MKIITIIIRTLIGLLLLFASITYFFNLIPQPEVTGSFKTFQEGIKASVYLMPLAKTVELVCGLAYVSGKFMKLANILLVPVSLNILFINIFLAPEGMPIALFLLVGNLFMIYKDWDSYKGLFAA
jgi:uncharacterized membrane protein YphA (DoxX/SURF4 family)